MSAPGAAGSGKPTSSFFSRAGRAVVSCFSLGGAARQTHSPRVKIGQYQLSLEDGTCHTSEAHRIRHDIEWGKNVGVDRFLHGIAIYDRPLESIGETDRLTIQAHGNETHVSDALLYEPRQLAQMLYGAGLRQVGILKISSCEIGAGTFLEELKAALDSRGVKVGYLSAPIGILLDNRIPMQVCGVEFTINNNLGRGRSVLGNKGVQRPDGKLVPERHGLRVVKGNVDLRFQGTRYDLPAAPASAIRAIA